MRELCRPGGVVAIEDVDIAAMFCDPPSRAYDRSTELYCQAAIARGADPRLGPRLAGLFHTAGLEEIEVGAVHPSFRAGDGKLMAALTLRSIRAAVLAGDLIDEDGFDQVLDEVERLTNDPTTVLGLPRIHQVLGRSPA